MARHTSRLKLTRTIGLLLATLLLFNTNVNADITYWEEMEDCPVVLLSDSTAGGLIQCFEGRHIGRDMLTLAMSGEIAGIDLFDGAFESELSDLGAQLAEGDHLLVRPRNGVTPYLLYYWTLDKNGDPVMAAGWVLVPGYSSDNPILESAWLLNMPWIRFNTDPLDMDNMMAVLTGGILGAGKGYTTVVPELLGFNPLRNTPKDPFVNLSMIEPAETFIDIETQASAATDLLRAAKTFCDSQESKYCGPAHPLATEQPKLFIHGYSQGSHGGLAALEQIQNQAVDEELKFRLEAAAFASGYYNMVDDVKALGAGVYSDPRIPESNFQSFIPEDDPLLARQKAFLIMDQLSISPYFESLDPPSTGFECGTYSQTNIDEQCINDWLSDYVETWPSPEEGSETEAADALKLAKLEKMNEFLIENSMVGLNDDGILSPRFNPLIPLRLSSCEDDGYIPPGIHTASFAAALNNAGVPDVEVDYVFYNDTNHDDLEGDNTMYKGHKGCALPLIGLNFNWLASFQPWENPFIVDVGVQRQFQICFFGCKGYYTLTLDGWTLSLLEQPDQPVTIYVDGEVIKEDFTASSIFYSNFYWVGSTHTVKACWPGDWCTETTFVAY